MKLSEKIIGLEHEYLKTKQILNLYPDAELINLHDLHGGQYYCSNFIPRNELNIQAFITPYTGKINFYVKHQINISNKEYSIKIYTACPLTFFLYENIVGMLKFNDYESFMQQASIPKDKIKEVHLLILDLIRNNPNLKIDQETLPKTLQNLLIFI
jgi:hypothetical protein